MFGDEGIAEWDTFHSLREECKLFVQDLSGLVTMGLDQNAALIIKLMVSETGSLEYEPKYAGQVQAALAAARRLAKQLDGEYSRDSRYASPRGYHGRSSVSHRKTRV